MEQLKKEKGLPVYLRLVHNYSGMSTSISASISASITTKGVHSCDKHNLRHHAQVQCFHNSDGYCMIGDRSTTKVVLVLELISPWFHLVK